MKRILKFKENNTTYVTCPYCNKLLVVNYVPISREIIIHCFGWDRNHAEINKFEKSAKSKVTKIQVLITGRNDNPFKVMDPLDDDSKTFRAVGETPLDILGNRFK